MLAKNTKSFGICVELDENESSLIKDLNEDYQLLENDCIWKEFILGSDSVKGTEDPSTVPDNEVEVLFKNIMQKLETSDFKRLPHYNN
jgi:hypothetical protein